MQYLYFFVLIMSIFTSRSEFPFQSVYALSSWKFSKENFWKFSSVEPSYNLWFISPFPLNLRIENKIHFPWPLTLAQTRAFARIFIWRRVFAMIFPLVIFGLIWTESYQVSPVQIETENECLNLNDIFLNSHRFYFNRGKINWVVVNLNYYGKIILNFMYRKELNFDTDLEILIITFLENRH